jgi:hypothetical protein
MLSKRTEMLTTVDLGRDQEILPCFLANSKNKMSHFMFK